jgi:hypothetical protein
MSLRRHSQSVFNDLQLGDISDVGIGLTAKDSDIAEKQDKVYLPRPEAIPLLDGTAENCKEILLLASYMIRNWQTRQVSSVCLTGQHECALDQFRRCAVGNTQALPPPVKYNRGVRMRKTDGVPTQRSPK